MTGQKPLDTMTLIRIVPLFKELEENQAPEELMDYLMKMMKLHGYVEMAMTSNLHGDSILHFPKLPIELAHIAPVNRVLYDGEYEIMLPLVEYEDML